MKAVLSVVVALLTVGSPVQATTPMWHWIWVVPATSPAQGWTTLQGETSVRFDGATLEATLRGKSGDWEPELRVKGRVSGRKASAIVTQVGTDASPARYEGGYSKSRPKATDPAKGWGEDRIFLRDGPSFLGLYRQTPPAP